MHSEYMQKLNVPCMNGGKNSHWIKLSLDDESVCRLDHHWIRARDFCWFVGKRAKQVIVHGGSCMRKRIFLHFVFS